MFNKNHVITIEIPKNLTDVTFNLELRFGKDSKLSSWGLHTIGPILNCGSGGPGATLKEKHNLGESAFVVSGGK